jgi:predicted RND superfamily exporter protein
VKKLEKIGEWIAKHRFLVLLLGFLMVIPSAIGFIKTRVNYDLLSYLPDTLETVNGQNVMVDEYGMGAFSMIVVEDMDLKDVAKLTEELKEVPHVKNILWYGSMVDISVPRELLPEKLQNSLFNGDATLLVAFLDNTTSSDDSMEAVTNMRKLVDKQCFISGMSGIVTDIKDICMQELPIYVIIAAILSFIVLELTTDSFFVPVFFLLSIGLSIIYNMGSNFFLGEISYITQALTAVLQLAVTMDYSIFLLESYEEMKTEYPDNHNKAMGKAIAATFRSVVASSITTVAGFLALCAMTFALGRNIGIVMAKGVVIGVICCITVLPAMILVFDKQIEKTKHKPLIPSLDRISEFITKHYKVWLVLFVVLAGPAIYGNDHNTIYYNIAQSLPDTIPSNEANKKLDETFDMSTLHILMYDKNMDSKDKSALLEEVEKVDGVKWALGIRSVVDSSVPESMIPSELLEMLQSNTHEIAFVCSEYSSATTEVNAQIAEIQKILKGYDSNSMIIGEAPLMKDLQDVTDVDLKNVNMLSVAAIFVIILIVFKSISLPVILVLVIEFAININMAVPYFTGEELSFVTSLVIGTIQLGATVDYAILMTNRYIKERQSGKNKNEAVSIAHKSSILSIITSGCSFFVATFGVSAYSQVDMIGSICTLLSRGALISMFVVILVLPAMLLLFDRLILHTTVGFSKKKKSIEATTN